MESHNKNLKNALDLPDDVESIPKVFERKKTEIQKHVGEKTEKDYLHVIVTGRSRAFFKFLL